MQRLRMKHTHLSLFLLTLDLAFGDCQDSNSKKAASTSKVIIPDDYERELPPPPTHSDENGGKKFIVRVGFDILDVININEHDFTVTFAIKVLAMWNDSRVDINPDIFNDLFVEDRWVGLESKETAKLWMPEISFLQMKREESQRQGQAIQKSFMLTRNPDLRLYYETTSLLTLTCPMNFNRFPFDSQTCYFEATTHYSLQEIVLANFPESSWGRANIRTFLKYNLNFSELPEEMKIRRIVYFTGFTALTSMTGFQLRLERKSGPFILNYYLPSGLFVLVSWTSFVIPAKSVPARISLIITTFLVLINITNSAFAMSPLSQGVNVLQIWLLMCIGFVFVTIVEYFFILYKLKLLMASPLMKKCRKISVQSSVMDSDIGISSHWESPLSVGEEIRGEKLDRICIIAIPAIFSFACLIYWTILFA